MKRNFNIEDSQYEWLRKKAFDERTNQSAVLRGILDRAMAAENKEATAVTIANLIQAAEAGRTLRQVLEAAYDKPAEEIGVELADINDYERDLDEHIIRIYAAFDCSGKPTGDVALVAGQTVWQDCETANIVTSIDEEAEETFMQTWVRVYPDMDAVFCSNNACDTVLVANGAQAALAVDPDTFRAFAEQPGDWSNWGSPKTWTEHGDTIGEAAPKYGELIAYYDGRDLTIVNPDRWAERRLYYGADRIDIDDYATTYEDASGNAFEAFQIPWPEVTRILGAKHTGDWEQDQTLIRALRAAGAADWVETFSGGWADEYGWGIIGPAKPESDR